MRGVDASNLSRVDSPNPEHLVAPEVGDVESEDLRDAVREHDGDQPGIVDLGTGDAKADNEVPPMVVRLGRLGYAGKCHLEPSHDPICSRNAQAETVVLGRSGGDVPKLYEVLAASEETRLVQSVDRVARGGVSRVFRYGKPHQEVGVDQIGQWNQGWSP
jgi:hypothetical protein